MREGVNSKGTGIIFIRNGTAQVTSMNFHYCRKVVFFGFPKLLYRDSGETEKRRTKRHDGTLGWDV